MTLVTGLVEMSNTDSPDLLLVVMGKMRDLNLDYVCRIVGKQITVEFKELPVGFDLDQIFQLTRQITEMVLMPLIVNNGIALNYRLSACWTEDGEYHSITPDQTPMGANFDTETLSVLIGMHPQLRWAVRDFNQGLMCRDDSPIYFYRTIDNLVKLINGITGKTSDEDWNRYHQLTGTDPNDATLIFNRAKKQENGGASALGQDEHMSMMAMVQRFMNRSLDYVISTGSLPQ